VSRVEVLTRDSIEDTGTYLEMKAGQIKKEEKKATNTGTIIRVRDLFFNTPARLKFLKSNYTEETHIIDMVTAEGFARENISINLQIDSKETIFFPQKSSLKDRIRIIYGRDIYESLVEIKYFSDNVKVYGYITKPGITKSTRNFQFLFVNRRSVQNKAVMYAIHEGYGTFLMKGKYPVAFIFVDVNPSLVDVNVHPTKAEVKFRDERAVFNAVKKAVENSLASSELTPQISGPGGYDTRPMAGVEERVKSSVKDSIKEFFVSESSPLFKENRAYASGAKIPKVLQSEKRKFLWLKALGQVHKTYLVGEDDENLVLIDQHAAHEKTLYEKLWKEINSAKVKIQNMLIPDTIEVTPAEALIINNNAEVFEKTGFVVELFGERTYKISAHPVLTKDKPPAAFVREMIELIKEKGKVNKEELLKELTSRIACRAAVKAGDELKYEEMEALISDYFESDAPYSCPHGRPAMVKISFGEIEKMFKRKL
jgi:DNA mismatch repair protein MutL